MSNISKISLGGEVYDITLTQEKFNALLKGGSPGLTYEISGDGTYATCTGLEEESSETDIVIASEYKGVSVTSIGESAFWDCASLESVTIPNSVIHIDNGVFRDCSGLTNITIPDSVTSIGNYVFEGCSSLKSIEIPKGITSIGMDMFASCSSLTSITIPDSVTSIGQYAFSSCSSLTSIVFSENSQLTSIGYRAFYNCSSLTSIALPDSVAIIKNHAFDGCSSLTIYCEAEEHPEGWDEGWNCDRPVVWGAALDIPAVNDRLIEIQESTRVSSKGLTYELSEDGTYATCTGIGTCADTDIVIASEYEGKPVTSIDKNAFERCASFTSITIPDSVESIDKGAFEGCISLTSITIPFVGATKDGTSDTHFGYIFGAGSYEDNADFVPSSLKTVVITGGTSIGYYAFRDCSSLTSITIPDSVTRIRNWAFAYCSGLTNITIPDSVTSISGNAFYECSSLKSIIIPDSITSIGDSAFANCTSLKSITIPDSVTSIGYGVFLDCDSLKSITIPDSVTSIGSHAFYGCDSLKSIIIPDSITSIGDWAFSSCPSPTSIEIPDSVTSIGEYAFDGCSSLRSITIPDSVTSMGNWAFRYCSSLTIYCEAEEQPEDWGEGWNTWTVQEVLHTVPVVWGAAIDIPAVNDKLNEVQTSAITELFDTNVKLSEDLYAYAPIGMAQKASNGTIGSGSTISASNPGKIGTKSESLKDVFNKIFGTEVANQPTINKNNVYLSISSDVSSNTTTKELGTAVNEATATYTITLSNTATAPYGYRCGTTNTTTSNATFYYPATKAYNNGEAQVKITLPSDNTGDTAVTMTKGTLVNSTTTGNILYCNFKEGDGKEIQFTVKYPAAYYTTSQQTRYGKVEAEVTLGNAQTDNTATAAVTTNNTKKISAFLAYKPVSEAYEDATVSISGGSKDDDVSAITIAKGYVPYTWELATEAVAADGNLPTTNKSQSAYTSIPINNADGTKYLYIYVPSDKTIKSVTNNGFGANLTTDATSRLLKVNGQSTAFNVYHVNAKVASGTNLYAITYN